MIVIYAITIKEPFEVLEFIDKVY